MLSPDNASRLLALAADAGVDIDDPAALAAWAFQLGVEMIR